jgi:hypothetical protein
MICLETYLGFPFGRDFRGRRSLVPSRSLSLALVPSLARALSLSRSLVPSLSISVAPSFPSLGRSLLPSVARLPSVPGERARGRFLGKWMKFE